MGDEEMRRGLVRSGPRDVRDHERAAEVGVGLGRLGEAREAASVGGRLEELGDRHPARSLRELDLRVRRVTLRQDLDVAVDPLDVGLEARELGARDGLGLGGRRRGDELDVAGPVGVRRVPDQDEAVVAVDDGDLADDAETVLTRGDARLLVHDGGLVPAHVDEAHVVELAVLAADADGVEAEVVPLGEDEAPVAIGGDGEVQLPVVVEGHGVVEEGHEAPEELEHVRAPEHERERGIQPCLELGGSGSNRTYPEGRGAGKNVGDWRKSVKGSSVCYTFPVSMFRVQEAVDLQANERVVAVIRRHSFVLWKRLLLAGAWIVIPFFFLFHLAQQGTWGLLLFVACLAIGLFLALRAFHTWDSNVFIFTTERLVDVDQRGMFARVVRELPWHTVTDVRWERRGWIEAIFRTGTLHVRATGTIPSLQATRITRPEQYVRLALELRHKPQVTDAQTEQPSQALRERLHRLVDRADEQALKRAEAMLQDGTAV